ASSYGPPVYVSLKPSAVSCQHNRGEHTIGRLLLMCRLGHTAVLCRHSLAASWQSWLRATRLSCSYTFKRGSSASRKPSPKRLKANTVRKIAIPGTIRTQGLISRTIRLAFRSQPQLGVGGCVPRPRKLSEASAMIETPTLNVEVTRIGAMQFGRICRHSKRTSRTASALAASTYVRA